jgi:hypothetical protein
VTDPYAEYNRRIGVWAARLRLHLGASAMNVHFEDRLENGRMAFDYRLRPGVVERSNALALMRTIRLDV